MKIPRITSCFCLSLRSVTLVVALLGVLIGVAITVTYSITMTEQDAIFRNLDARENKIRGYYQKGAVDEKTYREVRYMTAASTVYLPGLLSLGIVSGIVTVCVNLMLMWGAIRRRRSLMMPWIVIVFLCLILNTIGLFAYSVVNMAYVDAKLGGSILIAAIPTVAVIFYLWMCVVSHYRDLAEVRAYRGELRSMEEENAANNKTKKNKKNYNSFENPNAAEKAADEDDEYIDDDDLKSVGKY